MSDKQQTPINSNNLRRSLILILAAVVAGTLWFVFQSKNSTDKTLEDTKNAQKVENTAEKTEDYKGWKSYTWAGQSVSFKHPGDWITSESASMGRLYVKNSGVNLLTEETPDNFQQIWLSVDTDEASKAREDKIKKGESDYRIVKGEVKASTVKSGGVTINVYEYETLGGPTLEAYWTGKDGKRYYATNSTEVGLQNQTDMVTNLKKVLSSLTFTD